MFSNLLKATLSVAASPIALAVDLVTLPESAYDDTDPFKHTKEMLDNAGECFKTAVSKDE